LNRCIKNLFNLDTNLKNMKKKLTILCLLFTAVVCVRGQGGPQANHVALYVKDLKISEAFYKDVMQLKEISEPFHDGKHVWFRTGAHTQLHIIQGAAEILPHDINSHFAYTVPDLKIFTDQLDKMNIKYGNMKGDSKSTQLRTDGVKQVYFQDPDNVWIEVTTTNFKQAIN
jgi:lactoylglutathione lyase